MAAAPNIGVSLDFAHPFLTEVDFDRVCKNLHPSVLKYKDFRNCIIDIGEWPGVWDIDRKVVG